MFLLRQTQHFYLHIHIFDIGDKTLDFTLNITFTKPGN